MTVAGQPSTVDAEAVRAWLDFAAVEIREQRNYLTQLDAAIGDADHGANMDRGFSAVREMLTDRVGEVSTGALLSAAGDTLISTVGGASGALWGTALRRAGEALGNTPEIDPAGLTDALQAALDGIVELGAAQVGDKTMVDALEPTVQAMRDCLAAGADLTETVRAARSACEDGMRATVPLQASKGRASYLGERSIGHQDPGATSTVIIIAALDHVLSQER